MFTGLIETTGTFLGAAMSGKAGKLRIEAAKPLASPVLGESIAVNGACLTLEKAAGPVLEFHVLEETFRKTNLGRLQRGARVNLERALRVGDRCGGHFVQGHVDTQGTIRAKTPKGRDFQLKIDCGRVLAAQSVLKGSVAIDGVSLTISGLGENWLTVDLIPTTARETTLGLKKVGDTVNLEGDILGKYVAKQTAAHGLTEEMLAQAGFLDSPGN